MTNLHLPSAIPKLLHLFSRLLRDRRVKLVDKVIICLSLFYLLWPIDLICAEGRIRLWRDLRQTRLWRAFRSVLWDCSQEKVLDRAKALSLHVSSLIMKYLEGAEERGLRSL